jgi:hypothetical protein
VTILSFAAIPAALEAPEPISEPLPTVFVPSVTLQGSSSSSMNSEQRLCIYDSTAGRSDEHLASRQSLPVDMEDQPAEPLSVVQSTLDVFDSNIEMMSTAISSVPLPFLWQTLQQCPSTIIQSIEASLCVSAQIFRHRHLYMVGASSSLGAQGCSLDWLKREISHHIIKCTGQDPVPIASSIIKVLFPTSLFRCR